MRNADQLLEESRQLAVEQAALVGAAGSARPLEKGEELETSQIAVAEHWAGVYRELLDFSRELLAELTQRGPEVREEVSADVPRARLALEIQLKLHELHLRYWERRRDQLAAR